MSSMGHNLCRVLMNHMVQEEPLWENLNKVGHTTWSDPL
jgi:hypothetical protein